MADPPVAPPPRKPRPPRPPPDYDGPERRLDHPFAGLPVWSRIIAMVGIPGALAFFVVWMGATYLPKIYAEMVAMRLENERSRLLDQQQATQLELNYRLLQRICSNTAKTDEDRGRCFDR